MPVAKRETSEHPQLQLIRRVGSQFDRLRVWRNCWAALAIIGWAMYVYATWHAWP